MERLAALLNELEQITLSDISDLPDNVQHLVVGHLEQLQDDLKSAIESDLA